METIYINPNRRIQVKKLDTIGHPLEFQATEKQLRTRTRAVETETPRSTHEKVISAAVRRIIKQNKMIESL